MNSSQFALLEPLTYRIGLLGRKVAVVVLERSSTGDYCHFQLSSIWKLSLALYSTARHTRFHEFTRQICVPYTDRPVEKSGVSSFPFGIKLRWQPLSCMTHPRMRLQMYMNQPCTHLRMCCVHVLMLHANVL